MAFVLNAQLKIAPPTNLGALRKQIQAGLNGLNANVTVKVNGLQNNGVNQINNQLKQLKNNVGSVNKLNTSLKQTGTSAMAASKGVASFSENIAGTARRLAAFVIAAQVFEGITRGITDATNAAIKFQHEMVTISQVVGKDGAQSIGAMSKHIRELAVTYGASSNDIAKAANIVLQAGISMKETDKIIETLAKTTNTPTFGNIETTAKNIISLFHQFAPSAREVEQALNKINEASKKYATTSEDYIQVIQRAGGAFKQAGGNLDELIALTTTVKETTQESAESIGTAFKTMATRFQSSDVVKKLKDMKIELRYTKQEAAGLGKNVAGDFVGMFEAVKRVSAALANVSEQSEEYHNVLETLGGVRQISKVIPLIKDMAKSQRILNEMKNVGNSIDADTVTAQNSLQVQLMKTGEAFKSMFVELSSDKSLKDFLFTTLELTRNLLKLGESLKFLAPGLAALGAAKALTLGASVLGFSKLSAGAGMSRLAVPKVKRFAQGGYVDGPNVNQDVVDIKAMPGEFVINKKAAQAFGYDKLNMINKKQKFAGGGKISVVGEHHGSINDSHIEEVLRSLGLEDINASKLFSKVSLHSTIPRHAFGFEPGGLFNPDNKEISVSSSRGSASARRQMGTFAHELGHATDRYLGENIPSSAANYFQKFRQGSRYKSEMSLDHNDVYDRISKMGLVGLKSRLSSYPESHHQKEGFAEFFKNVFHSRTGSPGDVKHLKEFQDHPDFEKVINHLKESMSGSGKVDIKAMPGEYIINRDAAQSFGYGKLKKINKIQKFARGGKVGFSGADENSIGPDELNSVLKTLGLNFHASKLIKHVQFQKGLEVDGQSFAGSYNPANKHIKIDSNQPKASQRNIYAHEIGHSIDNLFGNHLAKLKYGKMPGDKTEFYPSDPELNLPKGHLLDRLSQAGKELYKPSLKYYDKSKHNREGIADSFRQAYLHRTGETSNMSASYAKGAKAISESADFAKVTSLLNRYLGEGPKDFSNISPVTPLQAKSFKPETIFGKNASYDEAKDRLYKSQRLSRRLFDRASNSTSKEDSSRVFKALDRNQKVLNKRQDRVSSFYKPKNHDGIYRTYVPGGKNAPPNLFGDTPNGPHNQIKAGASPTPNGNLYGKLDFRDYPYLGTSNLNNNTKANLSYRSLSHTAKVGQVYPSGPGSSFNKVYPSSPIRKVSGTYSPINGPHSSISAGPYSSINRRTHIKGSPIENFKKGSRSASGTPFKISRDFNGDLIGRRQFYDQFPDGQYESLFATSSDSPRNNPIINQSHPTSQSRITPFGPPLPPGYNPSGPMGPPLPPGYNSNPNVPFGPPAPRVPFGTQNPLTYRHAARKLGYDISTKEGARAARNVFSHIGALDKGKNGVDADLGKRIDPKLYQKLAKNGPNSINSISRGFKHSSVNETIDLLARHRNQTTGSNYTGAQFLDNVIGRGHLDKKLSAKETLAHLQAIDRQQSIDKSFSYTSDLTAKFGASSPVGTPFGKHKFQDYLKNNPHVSRDNLQKQLQQHYANNPQNKFQRIFDFRDRRGGLDPSQLANQAIDQNKTGHFEQGKFHSFGKPRSAQYLRNRNKLGVGGLFAAGLAGQYASEQLFDSESRGGLIAKGVTGGASTGAIFGSQLGKGVHGAAIGAVVGATVGVIGALKDFDKQLKVQEFAKSIRDATLAVDKFSKSADAVEEKKNLNEVIKSSNVSENLLIEKSKSASLSPLQSFGKGFYNKFADILNYDGKHNKASAAIKNFYNPEGNEKEVNRLVSAGSSDILVEKNKALQTAQGFYLKHNEGDNVKPEEFVNQPEIKTLIQGIANLKNAGDSSGQQKEADEIKQKVIKDLTRQGKEDKSFEAGDLIQTSFAEFIKNINAVTASFHQLQQSTSGIAAIFDGVAPQHSNRSEQAASFGTESFEKFINKSLNGVADPSVIKQISDTSKLQRSLPGILSGIDQLKLSPENIDKGNAGAQFDEALDKLGIKGDVKDSASKLFASDPTKFLMENTKNSRKNAQTFTDTALPDTRNTTKEILSTLDGNANELADAYVKNTEYINKINDSLGSFSELNLDQLKNQAQNYAASAGRPGDALDLLSLKQLNAPFNAGQARLGAASNDPKKIGADLRATQGEINRETEHNSTATFGKELNDSNKKLIDLRSKAQNLGKALENLTDVSKTSAGALEKLNKVQEDKDSRKNLVLQYLSSDTEGRQSLNRSAGIASQVIQNGSFRGFNAEEQQSAVGFLQSAGNSSLAAAGGASAKDVLDALVKDFGGGVISGGNGELDAQEAALKEIVSQNYSLATLAQSQLTGILSKTQDTFFSQLQTNQGKFLNELKSLFQGAPSVAGMAKGGPVGTDTVPAMLSPGEFIVSSKAASKHRNLLKHINGGGDTGKTEYLSDGGMAGRNETFHKYKHPIQSLFAGQNTLMSRRVNGFFTEKSQPLSSFKGQTQFDIPSYPFRELPMSLARATTGGLGSLLNNNSEALSEGMHNLSHTGDQIAGRKYIKYSEIKEAKDYEAKEVSDKQRYKEEQRRNLVRSEGEAFQKESQSRFPGINKKADDALSSTRAFNDGYQDVPRSPLIKNIIAQNHQPYPSDSNRGALERSAKAARGFVNNVNEDQYNIETSQYSAIGKHGNVPKILSEPRVKSLDQNDVPTNSVYSRQSQSRIDTYGAESLKDQAHRERQDTIKRRKGYNNKPQKQQIADNSQQPEQQQRVVSSGQTQQSEGGQSKFGEQSQVLAQAFGQFGKEAQPLIDSLNAFKEGVASLKDAKVVLEQNGNLNVNINGLETLKNLSSEVQKSIMTEVLKQTNELISKRIAEMKSGPSI